MNRMKSTSYSFMNPLSVAVSMFSLIRHSPPYSQSQFMLSRPPCKSLMAARWSYAWPGVAMGYAAQAPGAPITVDFGTCDPPRRKPGPVVALWGSPGRSPNPPACTPWTGNSIGLGAGHTLVGGWILFQSYPRKAVLFLSSRTAFLVAGSLSRRSRGRFLSLRPY